MTKTVKILGWLFIVVGVLGFVPALAPNGYLLGIFEVNTMHNIVHLLSGVLALVFAARGASGARAFSKIFGIIYGIVAVIGIASSSVIGLFSVNLADNLLHVVLALIFLSIGFSKSK
ncbi:DUF4383 domain-containing protein [Patescibacteria group bacterium]|nr:DUF4383 domain-containing protein [Patescibacteria group bacterium]